MHCTAGKILCGSCDDLFGESLGTTRHIDILIIMLWSYYDHYIAMYNKNSNLDSDSYYFYDLWHLRFFVLYNIIVLWWWWWWWDQGEIPSVFFYVFFVSALAAQVLCARKAHGCGVHERGVQGRIQGWPSPFGMAFDGLCFLWVDALKRGSLDDINCWFTGA